MAPHPPRFRIFLPTPDAPEPLPALSPRGLVLLPLLFDTVKFQGEAKDGEEVDPFVVRCAGIARLFAVPPEDVAYAALSPRGDGGVLAVLTDDWHGLSLLRRWIHELASAVWKNDLDVGHSLARYCEDLLTRIQEDPTTNVPVLLLQDSLACRTSPGEAPDVRKEGLEALDSLLHFWKTQDPQEMEYDQ